MAKRLKVLFLATNPVRSEQPIRSDEEIWEITRQIRGATDRDRVELIPMFAVKVSDLQRALLEHRPHIVHFSGVGTAADGIFLADDNGRKQAVSGEALAHLFEVLKGTHVVVLNSFEGSRVVKALQHLVDYTIGMKQLITDRAAIEFAGAFYRALSYGQEVRPAFLLACNQLELSGLTGRDIPELLTRNEEDPPLTPHEPDPPSRESEPEQKRYGDSSFINFGQVFGQMGNK